MAHYDPLRANSKAWEPSCLTQRPAVCPAAPGRLAQVLGGCGGTKRWTAGGDVRRSGPHELRWGGAVARALRDHPGGGAQIMRV